MNQHDDLEQRLVRQLREEAPAQAPARVLLQAMTVIDTTTQRRRIGVLRRGSRMPAYLGYVVAGVLGALAFATLGVLPRDTDPGQVTGPSSSPAASGVAAPPTLKPVVMLDTSAWLTYTSESFGYSMSYPPDWQALPMLTPSDAGASPPDTGIGDASTEDQFLSTDPGIGFVARSEPLADGQSFDAWLEAYAAAGRQTPTYGPTCYPASTEWPTVTVDGVKGRVGGGPGQCYFVEVVLPAGGRVYHLKGIRMDPQSGFDRSLLLSFLSTVTLRPETATAGSSRPAAAEPGASASPITGSR